jgi:hypothetical protein
MSGPVERLYSDFEALVVHLGGEPSLLSIADDGFRKLLLMSSASFFEVKLSECVESFALDASNSSSLISGIVRRKAISRQYHTWFEWKHDNANQFYALFGDDFAKFMKAKHASEPWLTESVRAFMELGRYRNLLVHQNFAAFSLEKTATEIIAAYASASRFVGAVPNLLRECNKLHSSQSLTSL